MHWDAPPPPPPVDPPEHPGDTHELVVSDVEQDDRHTWVNLDQDVVHLVLPPERFGAAWDAEPRAQKEENA